jgi:hypothetical protein
MRAPFRSSLSLAFSTAAISASVLGASGFSRPFGVRSPKKTLGTAVMM